MSVTCLQHGFGHVNIAYSTCWLVGKELQVWSALFFCKVDLGRGGWAYLLGDDHMHQAHDVQTSDKAKHDSTWPGKIRFCQAITCDV